MSNSSILRPLIRAAFAIDKKHYRLVLLLRELAAVFFFTTASARAVVLMVESCFVEVGKGKGGVKMGCIERSAGGGCG